MKSKDLKKLSQKQLHVLPYLISCSSYEEAARQSGVSAKQIHHWLKDPLFESALKKQRNAIFIDALKSLKSASQRAVNTLVDCLDDPNSKIRIHAADKILFHSFRGVELYEMEERLDGIEKRLEEAAGKQQIPKIDSEKGI